MHEIKCPRCTNWTPGHLEHCQHCQFLLREEELREQQQRSLKGDLKPRLIEIPSSDPVIIKFGKHIVRFGQVIFYVIVSFLIWFTTWAVG